MKIKENILSTPYKQGVTGSTPVIPTLKMKALQEIVRFFLLEKLHPKLHPSIFF